jgi:hypothetical protein
MKFYTLIKTLLLFFIGFNVMSVGATEIQVSNAKTRLVINSKSDTKLSLTNTIGKISSSLIQQEGNDYVILEAGSYSKSEKIGYPSLPVLRKLMEIPQGANPKVKILSYDTKEYQLGELGIINPIFPCQGPLSKCADEEIFQIDNNIYQTNDFVKEEMVRFEVVGSMRSQRLGLVIISPFEYNPVTNVLRVFENIDFEIVFENADFAKTQEIKSNTFSPYFAGMQSSILNYIPSSNRENLAKYPIKYVIISDPTFTDNLQPLVEWKKRKGFNVIEAYTDVIGSTKEAIKTYIQGLYDAGTTEDPAPTFILFVGDLNTMPTWNNGDGVTDRNYVEYTGDLLPEIFYGRMSAENAAQLDVMVGKTLQYEKYTMPDPTYLDEVLLVSGVDGSHAHNWGNGQINYGTTNYFNSDHGITDHTFLYPASGSAAPQIKQIVSSGVTFSNYTAHCSPNGWADPSFGISDIASLTNQDKYGLMIGNCCSSSEFQTDCFAEEIVRAENKGAVGYIGGSNSTYWDEDYYFGVGVGTISENPPSYEESTLGNYDRQFHDHGETFGEWYTTMDQVIFAGNLAVLESGSSRAQYYWDIYNLIGDPSLMVYFSNPEEMPVTHAGVITIGQTTFTVETEPYAYAAINKDGVTLSVALANENGILEISTEGFTPGNVELVITAQNRQPYFEEILVFTPNGAYVSFENYTINDVEFGNGNGIADFNEIVLFNVSLKNYGTEDADEVNAVISSESDYISILNNTADFGTVAVDQSVIKEDAFKVQLSNNVPDQEQISFEIIITDDNDSTWTSTFNLTANAPEMVADELTVDDSQTGNGNGQLDPGEDAIITIKTLNNGHCNINDVTANLAAINQYVTIESDATVIPVLDITTPSYVSFNVSVVADAPIGVFAELHFELSGAGYYVEENYYPKIGEIIEDWETGDFTKFDWENQGTSPWQIVTEAPYEGIYCAASGSIGDSQSTEFKIEYEVMGSNTIKFYRKVSSESSYDFLKFYIDADVKGEWSGNEAWSEVEYDVSPGIHTFKWVYEKDYSTAGGSDKAWVDYITLPTMMATTLYAGPDDESCGTSDYNCQGTATNYTSILWETNGTGTFNDVSLVKPVYTPSVEDFNNGEVVLTLNITDDSKASFNDSMTLSLKDTPETASQPAGPASVDLEETPTSNYTTDIIEGANYYNWTISPAYAGTFENNTENTTVNWNLNFEGDVWIKVAAVNSCGEGEFSDSLQVILSNPVGIISSTSKINLNLMPNPSNGIFNIVIETGKSETLDLIVVNNFGQTVLKDKIIAEGSHTETINLNDIKAGIYMVMVKGENMRVMKKMIIK